MEWNTHKKVEECMEVGSGPYLKMVKTYTLVKERECYYFWVVNCLNK